MKKFDTIANRKMKPSTLSLIQGHFECSRKRAKMVSDLIPIRETSYFQFESYIMRFGKKDERVCKTLMSEIFEGYPATGWQPMGKKNVGYFEEEKKRCLLFFLLLPCVMVGAISPRLWRQILIVLVWCVCRLQSFVS